MLNEENARKLLTDLLSIHSVNGLDREADAAEYLRSYFISHGIAADIQEIDGKRANVIAFLPGRTPGRSMIWNGHLDTVPYGDPEKWHTDPAVPTEKDGRIYARGASDMKSGLAAMVYALCNLEERPAFDIQFIGTCDEEKNGMGAETVLRDGLMADAGFLLVGEPTAMRLGTAQKGCLWLEMNVEGRTSHGAYPQNGANAVEYGMAAAEALRSYVCGFQHPLLGSSTAQVTRIEGGVANNMTPDRCRLVMDIRMTPPLDREMVLCAAETVLEKIRQEKPQIGIRFEVLNHRRAIEVSPEHPVVSSLRKEIIRAGYEGSQTGISFFTDASILDRMGEKDICLFGPGDPDLAHQPDEYVPVSRYLDAIRILQAFAMQQI